MGVKYKITSCHAVNVSITATQAIILIPTYPIKKIHNMAHDLELHFLSNSTKDNSVKTKNCTKPQIHFKNMLVQDDHRLSIQDSN